MATKTTKIEWTESPTDEGRMGAFHHGANRKTRFRVFLQAMGCMGKRRHQAQQT